MDRAVSLKFNPGAGWPVPVFYFGRFTTERQAMSLQAYIIHNSENPKSVELAERCEASCRAVGQPAMRVQGVEKSRAAQMAAAGGFYFGFDYVENQAMRPLRESQIAVFLAHRALWEVCDQLDEPIVVMEHDATLRAPLDLPRFRHVLNLQRTTWDDPTFRYHAKMQALVDAKRSYGTAKYICLPGTAAYAITPEAARILLRIRPMLPADLFVNKYLLEIDDHPRLPATVSHDFSLNV